MNMNNSLNVVNDLTYPIHNILVEDLSKTSLNLNKHIFSVKTFIQVKE